MRFFYVNQSGEERQTIDLREWTPAYGEIARITNDDFPGAYTRVKGNDWDVMRDPDTYGYYLAVEEKIRYYEHGTIPKAKQHHNRLRRS